MKKEKKDLINHIQNLKGKVTVDVPIRKLCDEMLQLSSSMNNLMTENRKNQLEKQQEAKMEQYSRRNIFEIFGISNQVSDENLEKI